MCPFSGVATVVVLPLVWGGRWRTTCPQVELGEGVLPILYYIKIENNKIVNSHFYMNFRPTYCTFIKIYPQVMYTVTPNMIDQKNFKNIIFTDHA